MEKNREYFKKLLAENELEALFEELFTLLATYKTRFKDRVTAEKYDNLVLLSGKLNAAQESNQLGITSAAELNTEASRVNFALLELLNELPESVFQPEPPATAVDAPKQLSIPSGVGNGLFWMGSVFMMMICLGSAVQKNWITFVFTLVATLICLPPGYHFLAQQFKISISNSIRVLLIIVLSSVGLAYAPKKQASNESLPSVQPKR